MKSFNKISKTLTILLLATSLFSCKKNDNNVTTKPDPTVGYIKLASGYADGAATKVDVYAKDSAFTGYNKLYIALTDSVTNEYVERAEISLMPEMNMATMSHAAPYERPASSMAQNMLFPCSVSFIMSSMGGTWTLGVSVTNLNNSRSGKAKLSIHVKDPVEARMFSFVSPVDSAKYFVGLVPGAKTIVGANDLELVVYRKMSMMSFPADSSLTISFVPTMPSMGHGSPNNVDPVHTSNGHYKGKVNYTMTGTWKLAIKISKGATVIDSAHYFDFTF